MKNFRHVNNTFTNHFDLFIPGSISTFPDTDPDPKRCCKVCKNRNFNQCSVICKTLKNNVYSLKKMSCNIIFLFRQQFNGNSNSNSFFHPSMVEVNTIIFYLIYFNFALIIMGKLCPISWICSIFRSWPMKINS